MRTIFFTAYLPFFCVFGKQGEFLLTEKRICGTFQNDKTNSDISKVHIHHTPPLLLVKRFL